MGAAAILKVFCLSQVIQLVFLNLAEASQTAVLEGWPDLKMNLAMPMLTSCLLLTGQSDLTSADKTMNIICEWSVRT